MNSRLIALGIIVSALSWTPASSAQCGTWSPEFHAAGVIPYENSQAFSMNAFALFDDGLGPRLYAGGNFVTASGSPARHIARWNGTHFEPLPGGELNGKVHALRVFDDGSGSALYVGGEFTAIGSAPIRGLARFDGTSWSQVGGGIDDGAVLCFDVFNDGAGEMLYIGGWFTHVAGQYRPGITRWDGTDFPFIPGVQGWSSMVSALVHYDDGSGPALFAGGSFYTAGGVICRGLGRWNGTAWTGMGIEMVIAALAVHTTSSGSVLVAGGLFDVAGLGSPNIAAWNGSAWSGLGAGLGGYSVPSIPIVRALTSVDWGDGNGPVLLAGGSFEASGAVPVQRLARFLGNTWSTAASGVADHEVRALHPIADASGVLVHVGGSFLGTGAAYAGGAAVLSQAGLAPLEVGGGIADGMVDAFVHFDDGTGDALYAGGRFNGAGSSVVPGIARFDGTAWNAFATTGVIRIYDLAVFDSGNGPQLHAGGRFGNQPLVWGHGVRRWNGTAFEDLPGQFTFGSSYYPTSLCAFDDGGGQALFVGTQYSTSSRSVIGWRNGAWFNAGSIQGLVQHLLVHDDGTGPALYATGSLGSPSTASLVLRWDGSSWTAPGGGFWTTGSVTGLAMATFDDGSGSALYVGGRFPVAPGIASQNVLRYRNGVWSAVGGGVPHEVSTLVVHDRGDGRGPVLIAGGRDVQAGPAATTQLRVWDGVAWTSLATLSTNHPGGQVAVSALYSWNDGASRDLFVSGSFNAADGVNSSNVARLRGCGETGRTFCLGDGSVGACPCGNGSSTADRAGCRSSLGLGGSLRGRGEVSLSADSAQLVGGSMPDGPLLYFQGSASTATLVFGDGIKCVGGQLIRLGIRFNTGNASEFPGPSAPPLSTHGFITTPGTRHYQARYRDSAAFCTNETFNYTNAVTLVFGP